MCCCGFVSTESPCSTELPNLYVANLVSHAPALCLVFRVSSFGVSEDLWLFDARPVFDSTPSDVAVYVHATVIACRGLFKRAPSNCYYGVINSCFLCALSPASSIPLSHVCFFFSTLPCLGHMHVASWFVLVFAATIDRRQRGPHVLSATAAGHGGPRCVYRVRWLDGTNGSVAQVRAFGRHDLDMRFSLRFVVP